MEIKDIESLIDRIDRSGIAEFRLKTVDFELSLKKPETPHTGYESIPHQHIQAPHHSLIPAGDSALKEENSKLEIITSPIVGTFYRSLSPDSPAFVKEGQELKTGATLCILEAMKVMNELEAEFSCRINKILVENQIMVEYGTPLFEVERLD